MQASFPLTQTLDYLGILSVQGPDAKTFLQGQVTCDMNEVTLTQSRLSAHCTLQGRIQSLFRVVCADDGHSGGGPCYYLILPRSLLEIALKSLKKYALFSRVTLLDHSDKMTVLGAQAEDNTLNNLEIDKINVDETRALTHNQHTLLLTRVPNEQASPKRFEILIPTALSNTFGNPTDLKWQTRDILAGIPHLCAETCDLFLPHYLNLPALQAVGFKKGCYLGQEIIARMHYKGNIKKHLIRATVQSNTPPIPGEKIFFGNTDDQSSPPGTLVCAAPSLNNNTHYELLIVLDDSAVGKTNLYLGAHEISLT